MSVGECCFPDCEKDAVFSRNVELAFCEEHYRLFKFVQFLLENLEIDWSWKKRGGEKR